MAYRLICAFAALLISSSLFAQEIQFEPDFSWRNYLGTVTQPICSVRLCHYYPTNSFESAFKEFAAWRGANSENPTDFMNFRVAFPLGYNPLRPEKYPVILMLHGAGESGRIWSGNFDYEQTNPLYDNNSRNLLHGGNVHQQAANRNPTHPQAFPGIIIFPQASYSGSWASGWQEEPTTNQEFIYEFLEWMVTNYNADINRMYIHGLSNGGRGTWDTATKRPDLFAAALPMSGLPYNSDISAARLETTPIRLYQGGIDTNPSPGGAESMIDKLVANGGNPQYILFPTLGHGVWNTAYAQADFWSWMLSKNKLNIYVFGGSTDLCAGADKSIRLGFSYGYTSYQWKKDGLAITDSTSRYLTIKGIGNYPGSYTVDFTRPNGTPGTSNPVVITGTGGGFIPALTATGSHVLPYTRDDSSIIGTIGQTETRLYGPGNYSQYQWYRDLELGAGPQLQGTTTTNNYKISHGAGSGNGSSNSNGQGNQANAGLWSLKVLQSSGCWSDYSNSLRQVYKATHTSPSGASVENRYIIGIEQPTVQAVSSTEMRINWTESVPDEEFFEIWRQQVGGNGYAGLDWNKVAEIPPNSTTYLDQDLRPQGKYTYSIRAMANNDGRYSLKVANSEPYPQTLADTQAPTAPSQLVATNVTDNSITLSWAPSIDNDVVWSYEVYNGDVKVQTLADDFPAWSSATAYAINAVVIYNYKIYRALVANTNQTPPPNSSNSTWSIIDTDATDGNPHPATTYTLTGLEMGTTYFLTVRARDFVGNYSSFAQALVVSTTVAPLLNGLNFKYYTTGGLSTINPGNQLAEPFVSGSNFNFSSATPLQIGLTTNFNSAVTLASSFQGGGNPNNFVLAFDGYLQIDVTGNYRFYTSSDDGSRLYIDGVLIINNDGQQTTTTVNAVVNNLTAGKHAIRVTYFGNAGADLLDVRYNWSTTGNPPNSFNSATIIPANKLFTTFAEYYSNSSGDLNVEGTWGSNPNGTGSAPSNFTNPYQTFIITNRTTAAVNSNLTIAGTSSRLIVGNNVTLDVNQPLTAKVYAYPNTTLNLNHTTLPQLVELDASSTVNMNVAGTIPMAVYGNLNLNTNATTKTLPINSTFVNGNLQVNDQVTLNGSAAPTRSTLFVAGDLTFLGNSSAPPALANRYSLIFDGNYAHTLSVNTTDISLAALEVEGTLTMNFNDASVHTLNVGVANGSGGLLLKSGSTLNLGNHNLVVNGVYGINPTDDSGEINTNGGNITVATTSGQTSSIYFSDEVNTHNVQNLTLGNTGAGQINVVGQTKLTNLMTVSAGTINMQGDFVLRSTSDAGNGTARIGPLLNGAKITGNITAERYMSGEGKIYRYISSPVANATVEQLQAAFPITGNFTGTSTNYPAPVTANTSMWGYSEPNYTPFPSNVGSNQQMLERGKGYSAFIREGVTSTTWAVTGVPHQGTIPFTLTGGSGGETGWNLIGNPYASPIKWTNGHSGGWTGSGVNAAARIRVNSNGTTQVITAGVDEWVDGIIAPGQAFWVQTTADDASLTIQEDAKVTTDGAFFRVGEEENKVKIIMRSSTLKDAAAIRFLNEASTAYDVTIDAIKLDNSYFNLSTLTSDNMPMALNNTTLNYCEQEVKLRITNAAAGSYSLDISGVAGLLSDDAVTFTDSFTQTEFEVTDALTYPFSITADAASKADGRFTLLFKKPEVTLNQSLKSYPACEADSPLILVTNSQPGVTYQAFYNDLPVSDAFMSVGGTLEIAANPTALAIGSSVVTLKAGFKGCTTYDLPMSVTVQRDQLETPTIIEESLRLTASTENAQYQWYFNGEIMEGQIKRELIAPVNGLYFVEVMLSACSKVSDTISYVVTAIEKPNRANQLYPNPTKDKIIITTEQAINYESLKVISSVGQVLTVPVTPINRESAEVDFSNLPIGIYILQVNGQRYRVLKE